MKTLIILILILSTTEILSAPAEFSVGPIDDADCDFNSIEEAINAPNVFSRYIRVSNQLINSTGVTAELDDVISLKGGYNNCADANNDIVDYEKNLFTILSNENGIALDLEFNYANEDSLEIMGFDLKGSQNGMRLLQDHNAETLTVNMQYINIFDNDKTGLTIRTNVLINDTNFIVNLDNGKIHNNGDMTGFGGGIYCFSSQLNIGEFVAINNNSASYGGGISANYCEIDLLAGDNNELDELEYGIFANTTNTRGAGVNLNKSIFTGSGNQHHPISISKNTIIQNGLFTYGGGLSIRSGSIVLLDNVRIEGNSSSFYGGAIAIIHDDLNSPEPILGIYRNAVGCNYSEICSTISHNEIRNGFSGSGGASLYMDNGTATINHTKLEGNVAATTNIINVTNYASLNLNSSLIINNSATNNLVDMQNNSFVGIKYSTVANNLVDNHFNVQYDNNNPQTIEIKGSIIQNGESSLANLNDDNGNHDAQIICSLVENDDGSGVIQNGSVIGDPGFIGSENYKLRPDSIAINSNCTNIGEFEVNRFDIRGQDRNADVSPDLGAYESISTDDIIFFEGFEAL